MLPGLGADVDVFASTASATITAHLVRSHSPLPAAAVTLVGVRSLGGLTFLVAFRGRERADAACCRSVFGVLGMLTASAVGQLIERIGGRAAVLAGTVS